MHFFKSLIKTNLRKAGFYGKQPNIYPYKA